MADCKLELCEIHADGAGLQDSTYTPGVLHCCFSTAASSVYALDAASTCSRLRGGCGYAGFWLVLFFWPGLVFESPCLQLLVAAQVSHAQKIVVKQEAATAPKAAPPQVKALQHFLPIVYLS
jgi:hypothetical protein